MGEDIRALCARVLELDEKARSFDDLCTMSTAAPVLARAYLGLLEENRKLRDARDCCICKPTKYGLEG